MGALGGALFVATGVLLLSMGGAIAAAPVTLPLLWLAVRRWPTPGVRWTGAVLAGLTAAEVAWAAVYVVAGDQQPAIWLVPMAAGVAALSCFVRVPAFTPRAPG